MTIPAKEAWTLLGGHQHVGELVVVYVLAAAPAQCIGDARRQLVLALQSRRVADSRPMSPGAQ